MLGVTNLPLSHYPDPQPKLGIRATWTHTSSFGI